jgi:hypothetical protein
MKANQKIRMSEIGIFQIESTYLLCGGRHPDDDFAVVLILGRKTVALNGPFMVIKITGRSAGREASKLVTLVTLVL